MAIVSEHSSAIAPEASQPSFSKQSRCLGVRLAQGPVAAFAIAILAALSLTACGKAHPSPTVIRVGSIAIDKRSVDRWTTAIARGATPPSLSSSPQEPSRQQALAFLIGSSWELAEASNLGLVLSRSQLQDRLRAREESVPNGRAEFRAALAAFGENVADVELESRVAWARDAVREHLTRLANMLARRSTNDAAIARYYSTHRAHYRRAERRYYDLIERIDSKAKATRIARRLGSGRRFAAQATKESPSLLPGIFGLPRNEGAVLRAVFSARVGVLVGPLKLRGRYAIFVLRRIVRARVQPLSEVRRSIAAHLYARNQRDAYTSLVARYANRWLARTDCKRGYVVQKCRQFNGRQAPEGEPFAGA